MKLFTKQPADAQQLAPSSAYKTSYGQELPGIDILTEIDSKVKAGFQRRGRYWVISLARRGLILPASKD